MKFQKVTLYIFLLTFSILSAQTQDPSSIYRKERDRINNLVHTKLKVDFNFQEKQLNGEEWVTLTPHFYPTNKVVLDAKAMLIETITLNNQKLSYDYDGYEITINLPKEYKKGEAYTLYIKYTARPEKVKEKGSNAITAAKGLYFVNPTGINPNKPTQVWTQGQTEANSCWFPTIDSPNQKTSQEIAITVPERFKTLSNGELEKQIKNPNNTRTDYWSLKEKHAPYLFFMGIGEYEIIEDTYKNIPVNYYVEKEYASVAKDIFGLTPEMIGFFADKLGVEYPWNAYNQIVVRDYVSGAMENTTAVVHGQKAQQMKGQLIDKNHQESIIAHEVFHHWFGNLVTSESWSNLALNESFASYGEYLWREHKYGKEFADAYLFEDIQLYKEDPESSTKNLVRFYYDDKEDLFDNVSYKKGGAILHMLRSYVGDEAFFISLNKYLTEYKFKSAEVSQLRLILEEITGKDLNWFFDQWFYGAGHPKIQVSYDYNSLEKTVTVNFIQSQIKEFKFPMAIDIFENGTKTRHYVFIDGRDASFKFVYNETPDLVQVNADGVLLADFIEIKVLSDHIFQLKNAENFEHKREALLEIAKSQDQRKAFNAIADALNDDFYKIRILALENIDLINKWSKRISIDRIKRIAEYDEKTLVQAAAIETLGKLTDPELKPIFEKAFNSKSYSVVGKALVGMYYIDKAYAIKKSKELPIEVKNIIATPLTRIYIEEKDDSEMAFIANNVLEGMFLNSNLKIQAIYRKAYEQIATSNNSEAIQNLVNDVVAKGSQYRKFNFDQVGINLLRQMVQKQKAANLPNRLKNVEIIKTGIAQLVF